MKECQSLKPSTAQNIPYAIFKRLDSWASQSWGHSTTGQWNNFYLCGPQKSAMWLLVQLLAGIVPKALSNPGPSDGKVPAWLVVPSGKPQSAPPCSHQEGGAQFCPLLAGISGAHGAFPDSMVGFVGGDMDSSVSRSVLTADR